MPLHSFRAAEEALNSLALLPILQNLRDPRHCAVYLKRLQWLLDMLGNPERHLRFVHIAGTSGKGTVAIILHEILQAAGFTVGTYTSPYVSAFTERWRVNTKFIHPDELVSLANTLLPAVEKAMRHSPFGAPSYFEALTALSLMYFRDKKCDWVILEAGCGGTYDATNIIPAPAVAIITSVGLDHMELLGSTRAAIARRKAGIFKKGSVAIVGETDKPIARILEQAALRAQVKKVILAPAATEVEYNEEGTLLHYRGRLLCTRLVGACYAYNARIAVEAARALSIPYSSIHTGLMRAALPGRFETVHRNPHIILDGAHNGDKLAALEQTIAALYPKKRLHLVIAATDNRGKRTMFDSLFQRAHRVYATRFLAAPRSCQDPRLLAVRAKEKNRSIWSEAYLFPRDALRAARSHTDKNDCIIVTGSFFLVSELRDVFIPQERVIDKRNANLSQK